MTLSLRPRDAGEGAAGTAAGSAASPQAGTAAGTLAGTVSDAGDGSYALRLAHSLTINLLSLTYQVATPSSTRRIYLLTTLPTTYLLLTR